MSGKYISPEEQDRREKRVIEDILLREVNLGRKQFSSAVITALTGLPVDTVIRQMLQLKDTSLLFDISTSGNTISPIWDVRKKKTGMPVKIVSESAHQNPYSLEKTEALYSGGNSISDTHQMERCR